MLKKVVYAGAQSSFVQATKDLQALAEVSVTRERVQRWTKRVGQQRAADVQAAAEAYAQLPLPQRRQSPTAQIPSVACVEMDGGRIQIRERRAALREDDAKGHWRETLVGSLLSMTSQEHTHDPCPTIPQTFVDPRRMGDLSRGIKGFAAEVEPAEEPPEASSQNRIERPEGLVRSVVATRQGVEAFGAQLIAAAHARGFNAARRKAFVADGAASNWGVHKKHFSHYTPILDFTHAVCYVYQAAMAGRAGKQGWKDYLRWAQWLWAGHTTELITAVAARSDELGPPGENATEGSPQVVVADALRYFNNQRTRMKYAEYRRLGLPITSSHVESTIKQVNRRVKGTEKFWDQGAEPILTLVADQLSETDQLERFWQQRPKKLRTNRCYQSAA